MFTWLLLVYWPLRTLLLLWLWLGMRCECGREAEQQLLQLCAQATPEVVGVVATGGTEELELILGRMALGRGGGGGKRVWVWWPREALGSMN